MKVGMRIIKTSLAVFLCIVIARMLNINPFYACTATIISMESSFANSYKSGVNRMLGTILGALVGLIMSLISPENPFLAGLGIIIIIYVCNYFKWKKSIVIGCTVFCVIMTNLQGRGPVAYSIFRALDTLLGIVIAILVNRFVFPPNIWGKFNDEYSEAKDNINELCKDILVSCKKVDTKSIKTMCKNLTADLTLYKNEQGCFKKLDEERFECYHEFIKNINEIILYIDILNEFEGERKINEENYSVISEMYNTEFELDENLTNCEDEVVFNYHIGKIILYLNKVNF